MIKVLRREERGREIEDTQLIVYNVVRFSLWLVAGVGEENRITCRIE